MSNFEMIDADNRHHNAPAPPYAPAQSLPVELPSNEIRGETTSRQPSPRPIVQHNSTSNSKPYSPDDYKYTAPQQQEIQVVPNIAPAPALNVTPLKLLRDQPAYVDCPFCRSRQKTRPEQKDSEKTWLAVGLGCLICPCVACLPMNCCMGWLQDINHYCEGCGEKLTYKPYDKEVQVLHHGETELEPSKYASPPQPMYASEQQAMPASPLSQPVHTASSTGPYSQPASPPLHTAQYSQSNLR